MIHGFSGCFDCNEGNPDIHPGADEYCDGVDNDCDDRVDEADAVDTLTWYLDGDEDGFGNSEHDTTACSQPPYYVANQDDCDDGDSSVYPGADEYCDGIDNDCNTAVDEECVDG